MQQKEAKPQFARRIFWDVDFDKIDWDAKASFVIERVFERGDVADFRQCRRYYGDERVDKALLQAKWLFPSTVYLAAAIFEHPLTDYRCYQLAQ
jgi:hypothetical protein